MTSHYTNTIFVVYLLLCLFITSAFSASSFIRQFTDDFNSNLQQGNGVRPNPNLEEAHYLEKHEEISSRDHKVSASSTVKGLRERPPSSYSLKMESFNTFLKSSTNVDRYESRPFSVGGYNWTLLVYPTGNKNDNGAGYLSLYVAIDNSTFVAAQNEVYADLMFYVFNNNERQYFTIQDTNVWRFNVFKTMWGFSQVIPVETFKDSKNGYLYNGDHCEFGVDVTIPTTYKKSELFTLTDFDNPRYTYILQRFSTLLKDYYFSDVFSIGGRSWYIQVYPSGSAAAEGKYLSMYLSLDGKQKFLPYEKIYVRAKLRVLNQRQFSNYEMQVENWYNAPGYGAAGWGYHEFIPLSDLKDLSKGFIVNDVLKVQVQMDAISLTKYFPS
uniref:MATH domain and coiled-coil domain-containing protein n=1 Tax=Noccaea caerulescens TaxID=107243 RepID=A0A1J3IYU3_NOCCA